MLRVLVAVSCCALSGVSTLGGEPEAQAAPSDHGQSVLPAVRGVLDKLPGVSGAVSRLTTDENPGLLLPLLDGPSDESSPALVQVRLSQDFLVGFLERDVNRQSQVREMILGTNVGGTANTSGTTTVLLHSSQDKAVVEVVLKGTVQAQTIGHNGPVQLHCSSHSPFESRKLIHLQSGGIEALPATTTATTRSTTQQIRSTLPGLRGRIAERIARGRVQELRGQADAIASRNTERRLNREFDRTVEKALADARGAVQSKLVSLPIGKLSDDWKYRSEPGYIEMLLVNPELADTKNLDIGQFESDAAVAVRVHRGAIRGALTSAELRDSLRPLLMSLLNGNPANNEATPTGEDRKGLLARTISDVRTPEFRVAWSEDRQWLEFHFTPDAPHVEAEQPAKVAVMGQ